MITENTKDIQSVVYGLQNAVYAIEEDTTNKELAKRLRSLFDEVMKELLPLKYFAYYGDKRHVSIFEDERSCTDYIVSTNNDLLRCDEEAEELREISFDEFVELFENGNNPDCYELDEHWGKLDYSV